MHMNANWIAALACGAALLLGACSGGDGRGGAGGADPDSGAPDPGPDSGGSEPTALERAYSAANDAVRDATEKASAADTDEARAMARKLIDDARKKLDAVVEAAVAAFDTAEGSEARSAAARARAAAFEFRDAQERVLAAAYGGTGWSGRRAVQRELPYPLSTVTVERSSRRDEDGADSGTLLTAADFPPVPYEAGKAVMAIGAGGAGDRLRMRGIPVSRVYAAGNFRLLRYDTDTRAPILWVDPLGGGSDGGEPRTVAGLTITATGLVVDIGGKGAGGFPFRHSDNLLTFLQDDGSNGGYDLRLTFGKPSASPEGSADHYWTAALMPTPEQVAAHGSWVRDGERILPLGTYRLRLSAHLGLDAGLEDPDDPEASARDDANRYLSYAAYGALEFVPGDTFTNRLNQVFPFHAGYDAFADRDGARTTDIAEADRIAGGTFRGRTMALQFGAAGDYLQFGGASFLRLRGDIELAATISGDASGNKVRGRISSLEQWNARGYWEGYAGIPGDLALRESSIGASGSFAGVIDTSADALAAFGEGGYRGTFYGPAGSLEAAGIWYLQDGNAANGAEADNLSVVGSFGAALVRPGGGYGVRESAGGS